MTFEHGQAGVKIGWPTKLDVMYTCLLACIRVLDVVAYHTVMWYCREALLWNDPPEYFDHPKGFVTIE